MPIERIDQGLCTGCGTCADICPMDVIRFDPEAGQPLIQYKKHCIACYSCEFDCPAKAIYVTPWQGTPAPLPW